MCCIRGICILAPGANVRANPIFHPVCVLVVRIWRFHRHGPGSIPGMGIFLWTFKILLKDVSYRTR